jgi:hypothetical protein
MPKIRNNVHRHSISSGIVGGCIVQVPLVDASLDLTWAELDLGRACKERLTIGMLRVSFLKNSCIRCEGHGMKSAAKSMKYYKKFFQEENRFLDFFASEFFELLLLCRMDVPSPDAVGNGHKVKDKFSRAKTIPVTTTEPLMSKLRREGGG